ncbi:hypothetical protein PYCCODRAFT_1427747 [Trametes coccinea BRFM310]|uniref:Uncharacterized protein n=1 Tax=Trametes coccinea (strain BRFM310) TaxID=1353009 RepID=A0A1Y2IBI0_TRAC3|nr:hypothetical protein PYCCODRAFT_1427747 [Trametes coccinea BRFM310]
MHYGNSTETCRDGAQRARTLSRPALYAPEVNAALGERAKAWHGSPRFRIAGRRRLPEVVGNAKTAGGGLWGASAYPQFHKIVRNFLMADQGSTPAQGNVPGQQRLQIQDTRMAQHANGGWGPAGGTNQHAGPSDAWPVSQLAIGVRPAAVAMRAEARYAQPATTLTQMGGDQYAREISASTTRGYAGTAAEPQLPSVAGRGGLLDTRRWMEHPHQNPWLRRVEEEDRRSWNEAQARWPQEQPMNTETRGAGGQALRSEYRNGKQRSNVNANVPTTSRWSGGENMEQTQKSVVFMPPKVLITPPPLMDEKPRSDSGSTFIEYDRARYLAEAHVLKVTLKPQTGFPETHPRDPYDLTKYFMPNTVEQWEKVNKDLRCILEVYGYVDYRSKEAVDNIVETLKDRIGRITGEYTATFYIADGARWNSGSDVDPPTAILLENLSSRAIAILVHHRVWSTTGVTFFVHKTPNEIPKYLMGFGGITNTNLDVTRAEIRRFFYDDRITQYLDQALYGDGVPLDAVLKVRTSIIENLRIIVRPGDGPTNLGVSYAANVYSDPPPTETAVRWIDLKNWICEMNFELPTNLAAYIRGPERCEGCHSADHNTPSCPFPSVPGWNGVLVTRWRWEAAEAQQYSNNGRGLAAGRGRGRGGRGESRGPANPNRPPRARGGP